MASGRGVLPNPDGHCTNVQSSHPTLDPTLDNFARQAQMRDKLCLDVSTKILAKSMALTFRMLLPLLDNACSTSDM